MFGRRMQEFALALTRHLWTSDILRRNHTTIKCTSFEKIHSELTSTSLPFNIILTTVLSMTNIQSQLTKINYLSICLTLEKILQKADHLCLSAGGKFPACGNSVVIHCLHLVTYIFSSDWRSRMLGEEDIWFILAVFGHHLSLHSSPPLLSWDTWYPMAQNQIGKPPGNVICASLCSAGNQL